MSHLFSFGITMPNYFVPDKPRRVYATFRVRGAELNPEGVTQLLGLEPTEICKLGEDLPLLAKSSEENVWILSTESEDSISSELHLRKLVTLLLPKVGDLKALKERGFAMSISCYVLTASENVETHISNDLLKQLSQLPCNFWVDNYFDVDALLEE